MVVLIHLCLFLSSVLVFGSCSGSNLNSPNKNEISPCRLRPPTSPAILPKNSLLWCVELRREESNGYSSSRDCSPTTVPLPCPTLVLKRKNGRRILVDPNFSLIPLVSDGDLQKGDSSPSLKGKDKIVDGIAGNQSCDEENEQRHLLMNIDEFDVFDSMPDFDTTKMGKKK